MTGIRMMLAGLICFLTYQFEAPPLDFVKGIPEQLKKLPFSEEQQETLLTVISALCLPEHGKRISPLEVCEKLKKCFTDVGDLGWIKGETIIFNPPHVEYESKASSIPEMPSIKEVSIFPVKKNSKLDDSVFIDSSHKTINLTRIE